MNRIISIIHTRILLLLWFVFIFSIGCSKRIVVPDRGDKGIRKVLLETGLVNDHYTGFALYDPVAGKTIYEVNADKYFVPASNTKIFTLYTALAYLPDSVPCLEVGQLDGQEVIRGTGNPAFLHPDFEAFQYPLEMFIDTSKGIRLSSDHFKDDRFGDGWAWNDYPYGYQAEKSALPMYGNVVWFSKEGDQAEIIPEWYASFFTKHDDPGLPVIYRDEFTNSFSYDPGRMPDTMMRVIPFSYSDYEASQLLSAAIGKSVNPVYEEVPGPYREAYLVPLDTICRKMMRYSDNFIAEQFILSTGHRVLGHMETDSVIRFLKEGLFQKAPDPLLWHDGSGLSRYNMFTPRTIVWVLNELYKSEPESRLRDIFAAGGVSGTIKNWYGAEEPFVYAKTGTLRNKHCLSGYLYTMSGRILIFSFMHNNFPGSPQTVKLKMQRILKYIRGSF